MIDGTALELASVRLGIAAIVWSQWFREDLRFPTQPHPVGLARFVDLTGLARPATARAVELAMKAVLVLYALGIALPVVTVVLALFTAAVGALWGSQGGAGHAFQAVAIVCVAQAAAHLSPLVAGGSIDDHATGLAAIDWSRQALVAVYLTSGLTKLRRTHGGWIWRGPSIALQIAKVAEQHFQRTVDADERARRLAKADFLLRRPGLARVGAAGALGAELASPLCLLGPAAGFVGGVILILFHRMNDQVLGHPFGQVQALLLALFANPLFLL